MPHHVLHVDIFVSVSSLHACFSPFGEYTVLLHEINNQTSVGSLGIHLHRLPGDYLLGVTSCPLQSFLESCKGKVANKNGFETETTIAIDTN